MHVILQPAPSSQWNRQFDCYHVLFWREVQRILVRAVSVMKGQVGWKTVWWSPSQSVGKMLTLHVITVSY